MKNNRREEEWLGKALRLQCRCDACAEREDNLEGRARDGGIGVRMSEAQRDL